MIARRLRIHGRVQGVCFRDWAVQTARELGIAGWVRNCPDGTVESLIEGEEDAVKRFVALAIKGPPAAKVERIDEEECHPSGMNDFSRCSTPRFPT